MRISDWSSDVCSSDLHVLNSVFLDHAIKRGLTAAIVHVSKIVPLPKIPEEEARVAEDLIFDRRKEGYDPLQAFMALFEGRSAATSEKRARAEDVETPPKDGPEARHAGQTSVSTCRDR